MPDERAERFRELALKAKARAYAATTEESRRAWLIIARDWVQVAEQAEAKDEPGKNDPD